MSSISVQCPCGATFEREVKRGRPAFWCLTCRELPIHQRPQRTTETTNEDGTVTSAPVERKVSRYGEHDEFTFEARERIESGVAEVNAEYKAIYANRHESFPESSDPARDASDWYADALRAVYANQR